MSIKVYITLLFIIFFTGGISVSMLLLYMNPLTDPGLALSLMGPGVFLFISSFLSLFIFFIKKVYYRGDINHSTMHASIRQAILLTSGAIMMTALYGLHIYESQLIWTIWLTIGCIEVMVQAIE